MRLAFVKQKYIGSGGAERYLNLLLEGCLKRGYDVNLLTASWLGGTERVKVYPMKMINRTRSARELSFADSVRRCVERESFDLVFSLERTGCGDIWRAGNGLHRIWLERRLEFDPGYRLRQLLPRNRVMLGLERSTVTGSRFIIANSHMVKADIERVYGDVAPPVEVIRNGVDPELFHPHCNKKERDYVFQKTGFPAGTPLLVLVGSGLKNKGIAESIEAISRLPECCLAVVGRDRTGRWERLARRFGVHDRVRFIGTVTDPAPWYRAAHLALNPSWFDPFPNAGLEALFCGTPVLTTRYSGISEVIGSPACGSIISKPSDIDGFISAVEVQLELGKDQIRSGEIAASVSQWTVDRNVDHTCEMFSRLTDE